MSTLIVYYSLDGNTADTAKKVAALTGADLLRLEPVKAYPTGKVSKLVWGGKSVVFAEKPKLKPYTFNGAAYDTIVFGSPVWASNIAPPLRTFIRDNDLSGKRFAAIACQTAAGADKMFIKLKEALGVDKLVAELVLLDPILNHDPGDAEKIMEFCKSLKNA
jgi:flavodoxin